MTRATPDTLVTLLDASVCDHADRPALGVRQEGGWHWMSYAELAFRVNAFRAGLAALGVGRGDRVAVVSRNRVEWVVGCYAAVGLGAAFVPMYENQSEHDVRHVLVDSGAKVCLVSGGKTREMVAAMAPQISTLKSIVDLDGPRDDPRSYQGLIETGDDLPMAARTVAPTDLAELIYTSGTTGTPKGVRLTHANIVSNVAAVASVVPIDHRARSLAFLPWAHVFGGDELHGMLYLGASIAICDSIDAIPEGLREVRPTVLFAVPRIWNKIYQGVQRTIQTKPAPIQSLFRVARRGQHKMRMGEHPTSSEKIALALTRRLVYSRVIEAFGGRLEYAVSAAAALSPEVAEFIDDLGVVVLEAYGLTEASACVTINRPSERRIGTVGKPLPGVRVRLDTCVPGAEGGAGEIIVYGHGVMAGYYERPEETDRAMTSDRGLRSGDLGRFDEDGFLYVTGRLKELYKLENGKYVAPAALEEAITLSPYIAQVLVDGANRPYNVAIVVPDLAAVQAWAREHRVADTSTDALLHSQAVHTLLEEELARTGAEFRGYERIEDFAVIGEPFSVENGLLTPTLKVKRRSALARYAPEFEALYAHGIHHVAAE
jgi:long-chain acyl-CoA synthetase